MNRRRLLNLLLLGGGGLGLGSPGAGAAWASERPWGYGKGTGPEVWGELQEAFQLCSAGQQQSPVDLSGPAEADLTLEEAAIAYPPKPLPMPLRVQDTGLTLQVDAPAGNRLHLNGEAFALRQFHFHSPSEHRVAGAAFPMELHLVHQSQAGAIAVLSVFLKEGRENPALSPLWAALAGGAGPQQVIISDLLPRDRRVRRYLGSLTTPPCSEGVRWVIFQTPVELSHRQLETFRARFAPNARPVQRQLR